MPVGIRKISFATLTFSNVILNIGFMIWRIMFNNFSVEIFNASATDIGIIQAVREIPGFLGFGVGALALRYSESKLAAVSIMVLALGLILTGASPTLFMLGAATFIMSLGFHYFEPSNSSQLLLLARDGRFGKIQGKYRSFESMAGLAAGVLVLSFTIALDYRPVFYNLGGIIFLTGLYLVIALPHNRGIGELRRAKPKKKYWLYYTLSFLRGCRRHIFTTFAIFLLVKNHGLSISVISVVFLANSLVTIFTHRFIGHLSDRIGERAILAGTSFLLIFIFTGYAYISYLPLLIAFFLIDNALFGSSIALNSYLRKIASEEDLTGCLSFGMTMNHVTAVIIPVVGGLAWNLFSFQVPFIAGAIIVAVDMFFALKMPGLKESNPHP